MRDSGLKKIIVGNVRDESWDTGVADGFEVFLISKATELADIIFKRWWETMLNDPISAMEDRLFSDLGRTERK